MNEDTKRTPTLPAEGRLFPSTAMCDEPPLRPGEGDLSRIRVITVPEGADPAEHVPARARYITRHRSVGGSVVRDRWEREPDRPCSPADDGCGRLVRCLNGRGPCEQTTRLGMGYLERLVEGL